VQNTACAKATELVVHTRTQAHATHLHSHTRTRTRTHSQRPCRVTKSFNLPCRHVFFTVGPRYNKRYRTAAESALYSCCRTALTELRERDLRTIGIPVLNTKGRSYETRDAVPIILRTIRRFLEKRGADIDRIVLVIPTEQVGLDSFSHTLSHCLSHAHARTRDACKAIAESV
jgi:O-acetyl-ADP-ribose deacetylase (regulator of RNase III)